MTLTDAEIGSLKAALDGWEWFGYVSTAVVFLGCVGEFVAEFTHFPKSDQSKHKLARMSLIILILGIAGELLSTVRTSQLSGQVIADAEQKAAEAESRAGSARDDAAHANERASANEKESEQLKKGAAGLRKEAEDERLARAEIEEALAERRLGPKENGLLQKRLSQFAGESAGIVYHAGDAEGFTFAWDIAEVLHDANWVVPSPGGIIDMQGIGLPFDVAFAKLRSGIEVVDMGTPQSRQVAHSLVDALNACGFDATTDSRSGTNVSTAVQIEVDTRPLGPQGAAKLKAPARKTTKRDR